MYIFIHIPKTAGTSLSTIFDYGSNRRILYDYDSLSYLSQLDDNYDSYRNSIEARKRISLSKNKEFVEDNFDFIYGHFFSSMYDGIFPSAKFMTCFRNPTNRLISHVNHLLDEGDEKNSLYNDIISNNITLPEIAGLRLVGNLQSEMLKNIPIEDLDHIFIAEKLPDSVYQFQLIHKFERKDEYMNLPGSESIPRTNVIGSKIGKKVEYTKAEIIKAEKVMEEDNALYRKALELFSLQSKKANKLI